MKLFVTDLERQIIQQNKNCDVNDLALKLSSNPNIDSKKVLRQISGMKIMEKKMPLFADNQDILYPNHLPLEQCSSFFTANYKKEILHKVVSDFSSMLDLTGGFGIDFFLLSEGFEKAFYVEKKSELFEIVKHNFMVLGRENTFFYNCDSIEFLQSKSEKFNFLFIDPARRDVNGQKTVKIEDCEPNIIDIQEVLIEKADVAMVKLSPMLDVSDCVKTIKNIFQIHIVATVNECKEVLLVLKKDFQDQPHVFTINDYQRFDFSLFEEQNALATFCEDESFENKFLFDPNVAIRKAGAFRILCEKFPVKKISALSHLYISDCDIEQFPGRKFRIVKTGSLKDFSNLKTANVAVRNFPLKAEELKKKLKIKDGGDIFLFATTKRNGKKIIIEAIKL